MSERQLAAIVILLLPQTDTLGRKKDLEIQTQIRDHLQGDLAEIFSLSRTNMIAFSGGKKREKKEKKKDQSPAKTY